MNGGSKREKILAADLVYCRYLTTCSHILYETKTYCLLSITAFLRLRKDLFLSARVGNKPKDSKPIQFAMNFSTSRFGLLFAAIFVMCFAFHSIFATGETLDGLSREDKVAAKHPQTLREKRAVKSNTTTNLPDILKRL